MTRVRTAVTGDDDALVALEVATWSPEVTPGPPPDPGRSFFGDRLPPADVLVADVDGRTVGYAMLRRASRLASHRHVLELAGLAVDPDHRRRGVARRLVDATVAEAARRGARKLMLRVLGTNHAARPLYESCGFVVEGVLRDEFRLDGRFVDDVLMARRVDEGGPTA